MWPYSNPNSSYSAVRSLEPLLKYNFRYRRWRRAAAGECDGRKWPTSPCCYCAGMGNGKRDKSKTLRRIAAYRHLLKSPPTDERFLIWSQSRCGTTLLTRLLDSHPRVDCEMELLARWVPWPELYVESQRRRVRAEYFGFKVFVHHLVRDQRMGRPKEFLDRMHDRGYRIIYLKRENLLRHSLSQYLRRATGVTHATSDGVVSRRYAIDVDLLLRHMRDRRSSGAWQRRR